MSYFLVGIILFFLVVSLMISIAYCIYLKKRRKTQFLRNRLIMHSPIIGTTKEDVKVFVKLYTGFTVIEVISYLHGEVAIKIKENLRDGDIELLTALAHEYFPMDCLYIFKN